MESADGQFLRQVSIHYEKLTFEDGTVEESVVGALSS